MKYTIKRLTAMLACGAALLILCACGTAVPEKTPTPAAEPTDTPELTPSVIALTEEEIETANEECAPVLADENGTWTTASPISCCFTSFYDDPSELNLGAFLKYYDNSSVVTDDAEYQLLKERYLIGVSRWSLLEDMSVPLSRIPAADVEARLKKYYGISLSDLKGDYTQRPDYMAATDAFYNCTSDFGPGTFTCVRGEREGNFVRLYSEGDEVCLTAENVDDSWLIRSYQLKTPPQPTPTPVAEPAWLESRYIEAAQVLATEPVTLYTYPVGGEIIAEEAAGTLLTVTRETVAPDGTLWLEVKRPVFKIPAEENGWIPTVEMTPYDDSMGNLVRSQVYLPAGTEYYPLDGSGRVPGTETRTEKYELRGSIVDIQGEYARISMIGGVDGWTLWSSLIVCKPVDNYYAKVFAAARPRAEELGLPLERWGAELTYRSALRGYSVFFPVTGQELWVQVDMTESADGVWIPTDGEPKTVTPPA